MLVRNWPSEEAQIITFTSRSGSTTGVVKEVRWGLVWRDFILEDGRVIPEHKILDHPNRQFGASLRILPRRKRGLGTTAGFNGRSRIGSSG